MINLGELVIGAVFVSATVFGATVNVAPDGPVKSLAEARDEVRKIRAKIGPDETIEVVVADGVYHMPTPLALGQQDTGTGKGPVIYRAAEGAKPVFSGGVVISGLKQGADAVWAVKIPDVAAGKWRFNSARDGSLVCYRSDSLPAR